MLKGICKEFVTVKIKDNKLYEEAIFILKSPQSKKGPKEDMLFEANRILCQNDVKKPKKKRKTLFFALISFLFLLLGIFIGFILAYLLQMPI